jgi:putative nucleotidyltransferase with HDIG domain
MKEKNIIKLFPEISAIKSKKIRQGVVTTWLLAVKRGGWRNIDKVPFTLLAATKKTLIQHTRAVTRMAMAIARSRADLDMDTIIAGGIIHDVGKLLEYCVKDGKYAKSKYGRLIRHPVSGYGLVVECGLPVEIAHIAAAHSEEGELVVRSPEAIVIHHCDFIDFDIEKSRIGKKRD